MSSGDRKTTHSGATGIADPTKINLIFDAELKDMPCSAQLALLCVMCSVFDKKRSYLYLRENSIESNFSTSPCFAFCSSRDNINVTYFDRAPYSKECRLGEIPCCCFFTCEQPKLEIIDNAYMFCCLKIDICCCGKTVVLMPFENFPIPCCCCVNRTGPCDNCFNLCGPVIGNPKVFSPFFLQPTNPETFVATAQRLMNNYKSPDGTVVVGTGQGMNTVVQEPVEASVIGNALLTNSK